MVATIVEGEESLLSQAFGRVVQLLCERLARVDTSAGGASECAC